MTERPHTRTRRALRGARKTALWAIAAVVVLAATAFGLLQTSQAKRWMAETAAELASEPGVAELRIGAIEGLLPFELVVRDVTVADADGEWLRIDRARMVPEWSASLLGRPTVALLEAGTVSVDRLPSGGAGGPTPTLGDALVPLDLDALRIDRVELAEPVFGTAVAARIEGSVDLLPARNRGTIRLEAALLDAAEGGSLSVDATIHGNALRARVEAQEPSAVLLSHVARVSLPGYRATVEGDGPLDRWTGRVEAEAEPDASTAGWLADLLGGPATVRSEVALRTTEGMMLHLSNFEAGTAFGTVTGGADLDLVAETLQARARIEDADLAGGRALLGIDAQGRATVEAIAQGPLDAPSAEARIEAGPLTVAGLSVDSLSGIVIASQVEPLPEGSVDLALKAGFLDATLTGGYALLETDAVRLSDFTVRDNRGGRVVADLTLAPEGPPAEGRLTVDIAELAPWSDLVGRTLGGSMRSEIELAHKAGGQSAAFEIGAQALSMGDDGDADITVGTLRADGTLDDILGAPSGRAKLTAENLAAGGLAADTVRLSVQGDAGTLSYELAAAAEGQPAYSLDGGGTLRMDLPAWALTIERFRGEVGEHRMALRAPATLEGDGGALILDDLALDLDDGSVQLTGRLAPDALAATLAARDLPAALADLVGPRTGVTGRIDADLSIDAAAGRAPKGDITLAAREIVVPGLEAEDKTALELDATGGIDGQGLSLAGTVSSAIAPPLDFEIALAAQPGGPRGLPQVDGESRLDANAQGALDLAQAVVLLPVAETVLRGNLEIAIAARGPLSRPELTGTAALDGGYLESLTTGAVLRDISLTAQLEGDTVRVTELTANDGDGGTLSGEGAMQPFGDTFGRDLEVRVDVAEFRAMRLDIATIQLSGDLRLRGTGGGLELAGNLTVDRGNINIPRQLPQDATVAAAIDTSRITVETPGGRFQGLAEPEDGGAADLPVGLNIAIDVPGQLFVRGRGLESEWGGRLDVTGTISNPRLNGTLEVRRGTMSALGRTFEVTNGVVTFSGSPDEPRIDFTAEADTEDLTAIVNVTGPPANLDVELGSRPAMPRDEILSRLFFGKSAGQISATQAVQLAEVAASLSGTFSGSGGITDRVRNTLGIDVLTIEGAEDGVSGSKVRAGKYLAEDVFLRVDQGLTPESSSVGVEIEVFENITIEGDVSQGGNDPGVGINYKLDY